jgi:hypothetical protein
MEIHAHSHTERKKWTHYFWEFLMLFLAVFCGFLAENQREHMVEHQREKEFMVSLLSDLKSDTTNLGFMHRIFTKSISHIDSLIPLLEENELLEINARKIYQQQINLNLFFKWIYNDRTINQLKNSGNFRLVRKKNVSDQISVYDGYIRNFVGSMQDEYILPQLEKMNTEGTEIFKSSVWREYMKDITGEWNYKPIQLPPEPYFISTEKNRIQKFINRLQQSAFAIEWFNKLTIIGLEKAVKLDSLIRKEYHLK